jgi:hypothetical protein
VQHLECRFIISNHCNVVTHGSVLQFFRNRNLQVLVVQLTSKSLPVVCRPRANW